MAYRIDFTAPNYALRSRRKAFLRFLLAAAFGGVVYGIHDIYKTYQEPALDQKLARYEAAAQPIERICAEWDAVAREYNAALRYYRLVWAVNPTNFLCAMGSPSAPSFGQGLRPVHWTLRTGGACRLQYRFTFDRGDKALQTKGISGRVVNAVTSAVEVAGGAVNVKGVTQENLRDLDGLDIQAQFSVADALSFKAKASELESYLKRIGTMRETILSKTQIVDSGRKLGVTTAQGIMIAYLSAQFAKDRKTKEPLPDFPDCKTVINVGGWISAADRFIERHQIPPDPKRVELKKAWRRVGEARLPWGPWGIWEPLGLKGFWGRFRTLDNAALARSADELRGVLDEVSQCKNVLDKCRADCRKKMRPFVNAYDQSDIFNKHIVDTDLVRIAKSAGIARAHAPSPSPSDEIRDAPSYLEVGDRKYTFTWVRWRLVLGNVSERDGARPREGGGTAADDPISVERLAGCVCQVLQDGPGYALESVEVSFDADGNVSGADLRGLVPVKKSEEIKKEKTSDVH